MKKQFRTYDVYYNVVTRRQSCIKGIKHYSACIDNDRNLCISVTFNNDETWYDATRAIIENDTNTEVKAFCKKVNKHLNGTKKRRKQ